MATTTSLPSIRMTRVSSFGRLVPIQRNCYTELVPGDDRWITKDYWRHQPWFSNYLEERQCARGPSHPSLELNGIREWF